MVWAALATAIMLGSGEGDDYGAMLQIFDLTRQELPAAVEDPDRVDEALLALADAETALFYAMISARNFTECLETADGDYEATREDYNRCGRQYTNAVEEVGRRFTASQVRLKAAVRPGEQTVLERRLRARIRE